jgi:hypothetical protein
LPGWLGVGWLVGWLFGLVSWLVGWLDGWLVGLIKWRLQPMQLEFFPELLQILSYRRSSSNLFVAN